MNKHLRNLIHKNRASMGLNFGQLAELSGYRNRSKWTIKICNFEREGAGDDEMVSKVIQALEIDHQEVQEAIQKDYAIWEKWANEPVPMQMLIRITGVIILNHDLPPEITSRETAIEYAQNYAKENALRVVLVFSRRESVWIAADGHMSISQTKPGVPNVPYASVGGKNFLFNSSQGSFPFTVLKS
ncbi:MAG: hypothetical protein ACLQMS_11385 [Desulfomonilaceae bacterium]